MIELLTVAETAALLKTTRQQVRKMIAQQLIPAMKVGNRQISRRMDTHGIIVVERFATFHYY